MKIVVLTGGVGGAKFLLGVKAYLGWSPTGPRPHDAADEITAIVNTADDIRLHHLHISPDLDSCMYTTSGAADPDRGWGRVNETWSVAAELQEYDADAPWFSLGDKDIATHLMRTSILDEGRPLSTATEMLCARWKPGVTLLPMTDDRVETHVIVPDLDASIPTVTPGTEPTGDDDNPAPTFTAIHFQEWWIKYHARLEAAAITPIGAENATPAPGVLEAIEAADVILVAPSNPVVSIGTVLAIPGIRQALQRASAPIVGISPIIAGSPVRGYADLCLQAINVECSAHGVASHYGARRDGGLLDAFVIADGDRAAVDGMTITTAPLIMRDPHATAQMVKTALGLVDVTR